jgi:hypothetical protein
VLDNNHKSQLQQSTKQLYKKYITEYKRYNNDDDDNNNNDNDNNSNEQSP